MKILFLRIADSTFSIPISPLKCYFMVFSPFPVSSFFYLPIRFLYSPIFPAHNFSCFYMTRLFINPILTVSYYRFSIFILFIYLLIFYFTILYWFCHTSTWIRHRRTCVPHPEPSSFLPPRTIPPGHPSAPAPRILYWTWTGDAFLIWYYTCFHAIPPQHPTLSLSHRVQKTVLYICVSFAVSHTGLSLPSF